MSDLLVSVSGICGRITLNRPRAINALSLSMVEEMHTALITWAQDDGVQFILVDGAGGRGLCAGGDIRAIYDAIVGGHPEMATAFFRKEYQLNHFISRYPKPYVVLMDGIVMGGGIGIASHGSHRLVTERAQLAMPETAIGFIPDVGGTYLLGIVPGELGTYMALTGSRVGAAEAIHCGLADSMIRSEDLQRITVDLEACTSLDTMEQCLRGYAVQTPHSMTQERQAWIDRCFAASTMEAIVTALLEHPDAEAKASAEVVMKMSPTSLKLTLKALRSARLAHDLASSLKQEFRLAQVCEKRHDLVEGIRAAVVDKDRNPKWSPARLEDVTPEIVEACFGDPDVEDLHLTIE